jgi:membrane associated rhomboid family serine protease
MARLFQVLRDYPVTIGSIALCVLLFLATTKPDQTERQRLELLDRWGAVVDRPVRFAGRPMFRAPVALWQGGVWRIPVCAFHHVDAWHLIMNCLSAAFLGRMLERRRGCLRMLLFLPGAAFIPLTPEFLLGNYVLGYSGVIAAMFGALCVLRRDDAVLREELPEEAVYLGGVLLMSGFVFTWLDWMPVANMAHMTGFFWGALVATGATGWPWSRGVARLIRVAVGLLFVGSLWFVVHPVWNGEYHWYLALKAKDSDRSLAELKDAVARDPQLVDAWLMLYGLQLHRGQTLVAWNTLLSGLAHNPRDVPLLKLAQHLWRDLVVSPERAEAERIIDEVFGEQAETWTAQLRGGSDTTANGAVAEVDPVAAYPLDRPVDLRLPELPDDRDPEMMRRYPPPEGDAVEGRRL